MTRTRIIFTYGTIAGIILIAALLSAVFVGSMDNDWGMAFGFLTMFIALSFVFVGVKRYRDIELGGVIGFLPALWLGLGIALFASLFYVIGWEVYLFATDYTFGASFAKGYVQQAAAAGASEAELAVLRAEMAAFAASYADPLYRIPVTFMEISPVALIVPLITAALLRNPRFMPARAVPV